MVSARGREPRDDPHVVTLSGGGFTVLRGQRAVGLSVDIQYRIVEAPGESGPWKTTIVQYQYSLRTPDGSDEILGFHWHPGGRSRVKGPHLHIGSAAIEVGGPLTRKMHIPTGRIALEEVLRSVIEDLGVQPLRDDWEQVLRETQEAFERWRTWPAGSGSRPGP